MSVSCHSPFSCFSLFTEGLVCLTSVLAFRVGDDDNKKETKRKGAARCGVTATHKKDEDIH